MEYFGILWGFMGYFWIFSRFFGDFWDFTGYFGIFQDISKNLWDYFGFRRIKMGFYPFFWDIFKIRLGFYGISWDISKNLCDFMIFSGIWLDSLGYVDEWKDPLKSAAAGFLGFNYAASCQGAQTTWQRCKRDNNLNRKMASKRATSEQILDNMATWRRHYD